MSINPIIKAAVEPLVPVCVPNTYNGDSPEYTTFSSLEIPDGFGDDAPQAIRHLVTLHYVCPPDHNPLETLRGLCCGLYRSGCTYPTTTNVSDDEVQDYILECEYMEGLSDGTV